VLDPSVHVTAVITHRVRPGREPGYETWIKGISVDARRFDGYLGAHILRPELGVTEDHVIVVQFDTCKNLDRWLQSETRRGWVERIKPLIREPESIKVHTGLEPWFQLPEASASPAGQRCTGLLAIPSSHPGEYRDHRSPTHLLGDALPNALL
jgi:antibiotic biosynthesis monooxygenase (ABM) superfamily enzyme